MDLPYSENIPVGKLENLFKNTSECYKFFWFKAILTEVNKNKSKITYNELINNMIADAWCIVLQHHLKLGRGDSIEKVIKKINEISDLSPSESKEKIIQYLNFCDNREIIKLKKVVSLHVPYRILAPFAEKMKSQDWQNKDYILADKLNNENGTIYHFDMIKGLDSIISIKDSWFKYLKYNNDFLIKWVNYNAVAYLEKRNPEVTDINNKITSQS